MGSACSSSSKQNEPDEEGGTLAVMFRRFDKENKGFISLENLKAMMSDEKDHFQGKDAKHIMEKYGTDEKMSFEQFTSWWNGTYTSYDDAFIAQMVSEVQHERPVEPSMTSIPELPDMTAPHNSNVAISRS